MLRDPTRCQVVLVTLPEETPVNELIETAYALEDRVGIQLGPLVVNSVYPHLDLDPSAADASGVSRADAVALREAAEFRLHRQDLQATQLARLAEALPLPQLVLPQLFTSAIGSAEIIQLAEAMRERVEALPAVPA